MNPDVRVKKQNVESKSSFSPGFFSLCPILAVMLIFLQPFHLWAGTAERGNIGYRDDNLAVLLFPSRPLQGQAMIVSIHSRQNKPVPRQLALLGKRYKVAAVVAGKEYKAVCAVPLNARTGPQTLGIELSNGGRVSVPLIVMAGHYGEEHLRLPPEMANPTTKDHLRQIKDDRKRLRQAYGSSSALIRFSHPFARPLGSKIITPFGRRRFLNEIPKSPHGGIDLRGKTGTPVPAAAGGKVAFSGQLYYSGNAVIIDHGLDIFSLYLHLNSLSVAVGEQVKQGQIIGKLGSTGRVTGPHLHWGIKINGIFVDPLEFIKESRLLLPPAREE